MDSSSSQQKPAVIYEDMKESSYRSTNSEEEEAGEWCRAGNTLALYSFKKLTHHVMMQHREKERKEILGTNRSFKPTLIYEFLHKALHALVQPVKTVLCKSVDPHRYVVFETQFTEVLSRALTSISGEKHCCSLASNTASHHL